MPNKINLSLVKLLVSITVVFMLKLKHHVFKAHNVRLISDVNSTVCLADYVCFFISLSVFLFFRVHVH